MSTGRISDVACPRCGCRIVKDLTCGCESLRDVDYCENCGRYAAPALKPDEHTELAPAIPGLGPLTLPCELGPVLHRHHPTPHEFMKGVPTREEFLQGILLEVE